MVDSNQVESRVAQIESRIDKDVAALTSISGETGLSIANLAQAMEFAKMMAVAGAAVPKWMRGNPGACLAITTRALRWTMDPFFVAEKSYLMVNPKSGEEKIAFESQLIHAVIEARAPIKGRLRHEIIGEGEARVCKVWATFKGETQPHEFTSETLGKRLKDIGYNDRGNFRGSPLWLSKPTVQMFYDASRDWAREFAPDVLAGVYTADELPDAEPVDVSPKIATTVAGLSDRLRAAKAQTVAAEQGDARGFDADHIHREASANGNGTSILEGVVDSDGVITEDENHGTEEEKRSATGGDNDQLRRDGERDRDEGDAIVESGSADRDRPIAGAADRDAGGDAEEVKQGEIFPPDRDKPKRKR